MTPFLQSCIEANEEIYSALSGGFDPSWFEKSSVGAGGDISSGLDLFAEEVFVKHLVGFGAIESEESGHIGEGDTRIVINPIDGSANALSGFPYYGTSVARIGDDGLLDVAVVCNLANGDIFIKFGSEPVQQGKLFSNEFSPVRTAPSAEIGLFEKAYAHSDLMAALQSEKLKFRSPGAIALSLAYARTVAYMLFVGEFRIYDFAAGLALCEGMEVIVEEEYVIVSQSKSIARRLDQIVRSSI